MKAPELIIISGTGDSVTVSFGRTRQRKLRYTQTVNEYGHIELERDSETPGAHKSGVLEHKSKKPARAIPIAKHKTKTELKTVVVTYRDAAKALIRSQVANGDSIEHIKQSQHGHCCKEYWANVGGYADQKRYPTDKIVVHEVNDKKIKPAAIFSLREIYNEIKKSSGAPDDIKKLIKEPLANNKQIINLDKIRKITDVNCSHTCKYFGFIHPCMVCWDDTKKYLCIKDWIKAGNRKITNPNQVIEITPNGDLLKIHVKDD